MKNAWIRNTLAVLVGLVVGGAVNMGLVTLGHRVIPLPDGVSVSTPEEMKEAMKFLTAQDFVFPFLAHALGTLVGAFLAAKLAASHGWKLAMGIGIFFLVGGISAIIMFGGPLWFKVVDLVGAYLPMAFLGGLLAGRKR